MVDLVLHICWTVKDDVFSAVGVVNSTGDGSESRRDL